MTETLDKSTLMAELKAKATALGVTLQPDGEDQFRGEMESIRSRWFIGGRKVIYRMSVRLGGDQHDVLFREAVIEKSWGLPPPTLTVQKTTTSGWKRSGQRSDVSIGGGGNLDYARVRDTLERSATEAGWHFHLEGGRQP